MRKYEVMYILRAGLDDTARDEAIAKVNATLTDNGATIENVDTAMGLRELAYPINDETKGFYVVLKITADVKATEEFGRLAKLNSNVLRYVVVADNQ